MIRQLKKSENSWASDFCPPTDSKLKAKRERHHEGVSPEQYDFALRFRRMGEAINNAKWPGYQGRIVAYIKGQRQATPALPPENIAAMKLLDNWLHGDAQEQSETWERLERALEENRSSDRNLFS